MGRVSKGRFSGGKKGDAPSVSQGFFQVRQNVLSEPFSVTKDFVQTPMFKSKYDLCTGVDRMKIVLPIVLLMLYIYTREQSICETKWLKSDLRESSDCRSARRDDIAMLQAGPDYSLSNAIFKFRYAWLCIEAQSAEIALLGFVSSHCCSCS